MTAPEVEAPTAALGGGTGFVVELEAFSGPLDAGPPVTDEIACPEAGPLDGTFYKFIDLKADFTFFKLGNEYRHRTNAEYSFKRGNECE